MKTIIILNFQREALYTIYPLDDKRTIIKYIPNIRNMFETNYARIKPFLLAKGRDIISHIIEPHNEYTVKTHTDSLISTKPIKFEESKYKLGSMIFKQSTKKGIIHNNIYVDWGKK